MDAPILLQQLENSTHFERVRRMVEIGSQSTNDESARTTIDTLSSGSLYERALALETCYGSRNISIAKKALTWTSKHLQKRALHLIGLLGTNEDFLDALKQSPSYHQIHTIRRFRDARRHRQRLHVIETFMEELESTNRNPSLFQRLLPLGSKAILDRHLVRLLDHFSLTDWSRLAKYHPNVTQKVLQDWIDRSSEDEHQLVTTINLILSKWLAHDYDTGHAIALFKAAQTKISMVRLPIETLIARRPEDVFRIILESDEHVGDDLPERMRMKILRKLPLAQFLELFQRYPDVIDSWNAPRSFDNLTLEQRVAVYNLVKVGWRVGGILKRLSLEKLPAEHRIKEARRHLTNGKFVTKPEGKIKYIALLPWDEAMTLQEPFLRSSDAEIRSSALKCQIAAAKFNDTHLSDAIQLALAHKNEQDPVKKEMMAGLAEIPSSRWKENHLKDLEMILRYLLDTSDTSAGTLFNMQQLVTGILSCHPSWASKQFATIVRERNPSLRKFQISGKFSITEVMAALDQEMSPVLDGLLKKKDGDSLENMADAFGSLVKHWSRFLETCELALIDPEMRKQDAMIRVLKKYRPEVWSRIVPSMFHGNRDVEHGNVVVEYVHLRQQNLLCKYLTPEDDKKQARREALRALSTSRSGFWRWTESQQNAFAKILLSEISDPELESDKRTANIRQLSALTLVDTIHLINFANDETHPIVQEAALRSLAKLDGGQGVSVLIEALSDKRARIAIYALRTVLKSMPKSEVFSLLKSVPQIKVTVAKETLRLIGELETDEAFEYLLERGKENLHIDVRLALFKALLFFTDRDETWSIFQRAAEDPEPDISKIVATIPADGMSIEAKERLLKLSLQLLTHPEPVVRFAILKRCSTNPLHDPKNVLATRLFELVHSKNEEEAKAASKAIFKTYATSNIDLIRGTYRKLMTNRKMLGFFHDQYWFAAYSENKRFNPVTHMVLQVLKEDRFSIKRRVKLMFEHLYWPEIEPYLFEILPELYADALVEAETAIETSYNSWKRSEDSLIEAELKLAQSEDERARRLALSLLIRGVDDSTGWNRAQVDRLEMYKQDQSPLVAEAAWDVEVDEESNELDEVEGEGE